MTTEQFLGICKLPLSCLSVDKPNPTRMNLILRDFKLRKCQREWKANFISVVVSQEQFETHFVSDEGWEFEDLKTLSAKSLKRNSLRVLDGCQRIHAALAYFKKKDEQWWIANIYLEETIKHDTMVHIKRTYTKTEMSGGEQYRIQRVNQLGKQARLPAGELEDFRASIGDSKFRKLKSFFNDQDYVFAFDALLPVKGLWEGFSIGNMELITSIKAKDEVLNYLYRIKQIWFFIGGNDEGLLQSFDAKSVGFLESEAPSFSLAGQELVSKAMKDGQLFPDIQNSQIRSELTTRISSIACPIPTIHTLIQDLRFLNPLSKQMFELQKLLIIPEPEAWIDSRTIKDIFIEREAGLRGETAQNTIESQYFELWLFLMRNFAALSGERPRSGHKKTTKIMPMVCKYRWAQFVDCARSMGFTMKEDASPLADILTREIREMLERAGKYAQDSKIIDFVNSVHNTTSHFGVENPSPSFVGSTHIKKFLRCGLPSKHACEVASNMLFLHNIKVDKLVQVQEEESNCNISEFCILHFFFINFFCPNSPFSTLYPNNPPESPQGGPHSSDDANTVPMDQDRNDAANQPPPSDRAGNEPPLSESVTNQPSPPEGTVNQPPVGITQERDVTLVLGLFEDELGDIFETGWRLLCHVPSEKRWKFFSGISKIQGDSITFVSQHCKKLPIDHLAIQNNRIDESIIFGLIQLKGNVKHYTPVSTNGDLVTALLSHDPEEMRPAPDQIGSLVKWIWENDGKLGDVKTVVWFNKGKRKAAPVEGPEGPEGPRSQRVKELKENSKDRNKQHGFEDINEYGEELL